MTDKGRALCLHVVERINKLVPPGFDAKADAPWIATAPASVGLLDALREWEAGDTPGRRATLQAASDAFVAAWREAVA